MSIQERKSNLFSLIQEIQDTAVLDWLEGIIKWKKSGSVLSNEETKYLLNINKGIPDDTLSRFEELRQKKKDSSLTPIEDVEIKKLIAIIELAEGERLENMVALANLWNMSLNDLRKKLQISPPEPHA